MYSVSFNDTKAFREVFKKYTGMSQLDYCNMYNWKARPDALLTSLKKEIQLYK
jgi:AraC-like DNA-binding protein